MCIYVCACVCVCVNVLMTGQLWARQDTKESSHKPFQALWSLLHKYTVENHANRQQPSIILGVKSNFSPGPSLKQPIVSKLFAGRWFWWVTLELNCL